MSPTAPRLPPRFVPTLTEVVQAAPSQAATASAALPSAAAAHAAPPPVDVQAFEDQLVHRVLQRIDTQLEAQLREAVAAAVQEQAAHLNARLRIDIETALRSTVSAALARELGNAG